MIFDLIQGGVTKLDIAMILLTFPVVLISLCFHELSHGYIAYKLGDPTARWNGRLTMNPLKHLDPIGTASMLLFGIGWARPVPINPRNFKNPKKGMAITGLAGPVSNLILAFVSMLAFKILNAAAELKFDMYKGAIYYLHGEYGILDFIALFLILSTILNISLAVFNMIPVPPFDGSRVFYFLLPDKYYFSVMRYERQIMLITMVLLFAGVFDKPLYYVRAGVMSVFDFILGLVPFL